MTPTNPYSPSDSTESSLEVDQDRHVANGCAIVSIVLGVFGSTSAVFSVYAFGRYLLQMQSQFPRPNGDLLAGLMTFVVGVCWLAAAAFAYKMNHVWSVLAFSAGVTTYVLLASLV